MAKIRWTSEAENWLHDIFDYIARDDPESAGRIVDGIFDRVRMLEDFPESGYLYQRNASRDIRILLFGHYRIAYLLKSGGSIDILGVFHGSLEIDRYLL